MERTYNGWTNYETWAVNLWLGNDEGSDSYWREAAQECWEESETECSFARAERATLTLADRLKEEVEDGNPLADAASLYSDLLSAAISEVNWYEIAEHFVSDVDQTWEESEEYDCVLDDPRQFLTDSREYLRENSGQFPHVVEAYHVLESAIDSLPERLACDQCEMLSINGVPCHETGCPNMGARWDSESGEWVKQRECFDCGCTVDADDPCCSAPVEDDGNE